MPEWEEKIQGEDLLAKFQAMDYMEMTEKAQSIKELDIDLMLRTVDYIKVHESGVVMTVFLDKKNVG